MSNKRTDILITANRLFNRFDFVSVGVDRIIAESNVAKMTFYKHFESKDKLIAECLLVRDSEIRMQLTHAVQDAQKRNQEKIEGVLNWYKDWLYSADFYGSVFLKAVNQFPNNQRIGDIAIEHSNWLKKMFKVALDSEEKSEYLFTLLNGAIVREQVYKDKTSLNPITFQTWDI